MVGRLEWVCRRRRRRCRGVLRLSTHLMPVQFIVISWQRGLGVGGAGGGRTPAGPEAGEARRHAVLVEGGAHCAAARRRVFAPSWMTTVALHQAFEVLQNCVPPSDSSCWVCPCCGCVTRCLKHRRVTCLQGGGVARASLTGVPVRYSSDPQTS